MKNKLVASLTVIIFLNTQLYARTGGVTIEQEVKRFADNYQKMSKYDLRDSSKKIIEIAEAKGLTIRQLARTISDTLELNLSDEDIQITMNDLENENYQPQDIETLIVEGNTDQRLIFAGILLLFYLITRFIQGY